MQEFFESQSCLAINPIISSPTLRKPSIKTTAEEINNEFHKIHNSVCHIFAPHPKYINPKNTWNSLSGEAILLNPCILYKYYVCIFTCWPKISSQISGEYFYSYKYYFHLTLKISTITNALCGFSYLV